MTDQKSQISAEIEIALLKQGMEHRDKQIDSLNESLKNLTTKVDDIALTLQQAKGGWKMLMLVGGASGVMGGAIHWFLNNVTMKIGQ
jgi:prefoldin subunit 5